MVTPLLAAGSYCFRYSDAIVRNRLPASIYFPIPDNPARRYLLRGRERVPYSIMLAKPLVQPALTAVSNPSPSTMSRYLGA